MKESNKDKNKAWFGTILFHATLLIIFLFTGLSYTIPPPPEEGISINFGTDDLGEGEINETTEVTKENNTENINENNSISEEINSQETEKTIEIKKENKSKKNNSDNNEEETKEEEEKIINKKAIFNPNKNKNNQGDNDGDGDLGNLDGDPNADNYAGKGFGDGLSNIGAYRSKPKDTLDHQLGMGEGYVTIDVIVNSEGKIISVNDNSFKSSLGFPNKTKRENLYKSIKKDLKYGPATGIDNSNKVAKLKIFFKH